MSRMRLLLLHEILYPTLILETKANNNSATQIRKPQMRLSYMILMMLMTVIPHCHSRNLIIMIKMMKVIVIPYCYCMCTEALVPKDDLDQPCMGSNNPSNDISSTTYQQELESNS